nr:MAG TPA: hypothetical protein [Caudoviricetes sp.]
MSPSSVFRSKWEASLLMKSAICWAICSFEPCNVSLSRSISC